MNKVFQVIVEFIGTRAFYITAESETEASEKAMQMSDGWDAATVVSRSVVDVCDETKEHS